MSPVALLFFFICYICYIYVFFENKNQVHNKWLIALKYKKN